MLPSQHIMPEHYQKATWEEEATVGTKKEERLKSRKRNIRASIV
jgi:hypothetical protein